MSRSKKVLQTLFDQQKHFSNAKYKEDECIFYQFQKVHLGFKDRQMNSIVYFTYM